MELPEGQDELEWIATLLCDMYSQIGTLFSAFREYCTLQSCPEMKAGSRFTYKWADGNKIRKPLTVAACRYMDYLMAWVEEQTLHFPRKADDTFAADTTKTISNCFRRLFRAFAHLYYAHLNEMVQLGLLAHANTLLLLFFYAASTFKLVKEADLVPLLDVIEILVAHDEDGGGSSDATKAREEAAK